MGRFFKFLEIYETTILANDVRSVVVDPVKIEVFRGPRTFSVSLTSAPVVQQGRPATLAAQGQVFLPAGSRFVALTARTALLNPEEGRRYCEAAIDRTVAGLATLLGPHIFARRVYRGWTVSDDGSTIIESELRIEPTVTLNPQTLEDDLQRIRSTTLKDPDMNSRFDLMSRFYSKALVRPPSEERFLFLWTVLEIFPMKGTTNIGPISELVSRLTGHDSIIVKERLAIGRMFGLRSDLVHNGSFDPRQTGIPGFWTRLESLCLETLRNVGGLPYSGSLNEFLAEHREPTG